LLDGEHKIAAHEDPEDEDQMVYLPVIRTSVVDSTTETKNTAYGMTVVVDSVSYDGLIAGRSYTLKADLMDKDTEESVGFGSEITFTAKTASGVVEVPILLDTLTLEGKSIVAFEELYAGETEIAEHKEIGDEGQTAHVPRITTSAIDVSTETKTTAYGESVVLRDTVTYHNLIPGTTYTMRGVLMDNNV
jgi:hypothetical protein